MESDDSSLSSSFIKAKRRVARVRQKKWTLSLNSGSYRPSIDRVKSLAQAVVFQGGMVLAVSIDIVNAFNSLPWMKIKKVSGKEKHVSRENQLNSTPKAPAVPTRKPKILVFTSCDASGQGNKRHDQVLLHSSHRFPLLDYGGGVDIVAQS